MDVIDWASKNWEFLLVGAVPVSLSVIAIVLSVRSLRWEKTSAEAAMRSANAAEVANQLTKQLLTRENLIERSPDEPGNVQWEITRPSGNLFRLRNIGTDTAEDVTIPAETTSGITRGLPDGATLRPNEAVEFLIHGRMGSPIPHTVYLTWRGQEEPIAVPMPS